MIFFPILATLLSSMYLYRLIVKPIYSTKYVLKSITFSDKELSSYIGDYHLSKYTNYKVINEVSLLIKELKYHKNNLKKSKYYLINFVIIHSKNNTFISNFCITSLYKNTIINVLKPSLICHSELNINIYSSTTKFLINSSCYIGFDIFIKIILDNGETLIDFLSGEKGYLLINFTNIEKYFILI